MGQILMVGALSVASMGGFLLMVWKENQLRRDRVEMPEYMWRVHRFGKWTFMGLAWLSVAVLAVLDIQLLLENMRMGDDR